MDQETAALACQRDLFAVPRDVIFMNAASKSVLPVRTVEAGRIGATVKGEPWKIDEQARYDQADDIRARFARLIGADADDIAIQPAASYGVATAARNLHPEPSQRIVVIEGQYPSNVYAWRDLANQTGAEMVTVPRPEDGDWTAAVLAQIDERTAIAALPPCHWTDGTLLDLVRIGAALKDTGAVFLVDATQWAGAVPFDVDAVRADYVVCAAYKWLLGPYGLAFMYVRPERQDGLPLEEHLFNHGGVASITGGLGYPDAFTDGARRFDAGQFLNLITLPMIQESLAQIEDWQPARIAAYLAPVIARIATGVEALGLRVAPPTQRAPHFLGVRHPQGFPSDMLGRLEAAGVFVSSRGGALRISPYLFNDEADVDGLLRRIGESLNGG